MENDEEKNARIVERFSDPRQHIVRFVEDRLDSILRELSRFRSYDLACYESERSAHDYTSEEGHFLHTQELEAALRLGDAYYRQFRASDPIVAPLPLYYGSMWFARAVIAKQWTSEELGKGLSSHGMRAKFINDPQTLDSYHDYFKIREEIIRSTQIEIRKDGRLAIFSRTIGGDDTFSQGVKLGELFSCVPELDSHLEETRLARVFPRDASGFFDKERAMPSHCLFDYRLPIDDSNPVGADPVEFEKEFPLAPAFRDRDAMVQMRQVSFKQRGAEDGADLRMLTVSTPQGLYLERRLSTGEYLPEMAVHLAIQHALSELVRYHSAMWMEIADASTEEYALIREFMDISSRKFPLLILNELSWKTYDFIRH